MTIFVVDSKRPSHWQSLNEIYPAAREALMLAFPEVQWRDIDLPLQGCAAGDAIYVLSAEAPLDTILRDVSMEATVFLPIYGDMTIEHEKWRRWDTALRGRKILFLAATARSAEQIRVLVQNPSLAILPYPVANQFFEAERPAGEASSLVYAGRITPQKNVLELMEMFLASKRWGRDGCLEIAGQFHDRGYHFHSRLVDHAAFVKRFHELVDASSGSILFHGALSQSELRERFCRARQVVSLSTYHDEDYGLAVAQALASGCAPLLSNWGGHAFFLACPGASSVEVRLDDFAIPHPHVKSVAKALVDEPSETHAALQIRSWAREHFSITAIAGKLRSLLTTPASTYTGQSEIFHQFCATYDRGRPVPFHHKDAGFKELYLQIYSSYLGASSQVDHRSP
jgi:glycosyltransferase involved in cell wall biosynthesis